MIKIPALIQLVLSSLHTKVNLMESLLGIVLWRKHIINYKTNIMKKNFLIIALLIFSTHGIAQTVTFTKLTSAGYSRSLGFNDSNLSIDPPPNSYRLINYASNFLGADASLNFDRNFGNTSWITTMTIKEDKVGIGSLNPDEALTVAGTVHAEEVRVDLAIPPDYVFEKYYNGLSTLKEDYKMLSLEEVEAFTRKNNHLPDVPSAKQIQEEGLHLKEMTSLLLQKIEELTIYTIEQEKRIQTLEQVIINSKE